MITELHRDALGSFTERGFAVEMGGEETVRFTYEGVFIKRLSHLGITREVLQAECARHLVMKHGWDGALWQKNN